MLRSYSAEVLKFRRRPAVWVVLAVWLALGMTFTYLFPFLTYRSATDPRRAAQLLAPILPAQLPGHAISGYPMWGGALIVVLGALCLGSEYGWGTLKTMLSNRPGRLTVYGAQVATLVTAVAALVAVDFALSGAASLLIARSAGAATDLPAAGDVGRAMAAGWLILCMWCLFGVSLAVLLRGTAPLVDLIGTIEKGLPGVNAGSLAAGLGSAGAGVSTGGGGGFFGVAATVGAIQGLWVVALYLVVFAAAGALALRLRDVQ